MTSATARSWSAVASSPDVLRSDDDGRWGRPDGAAAQRGDRRGLELADPDEGLINEPEGAVGLVGRQVAGRLGEDVAVRPRAEERPARHHHGADARVRIDAVAHRHELGGHVEGQGVAPVGSVEAKHADSAVELD